MIHELKEKEEKANNSNKLIANQVEKRIQEEKQINRALDIQYDIQ